MTKLLSIQGGDFLVICNNNGPHGKAQNYQALDVGWNNPNRYKIYAPIRGKITRYWGKFIDTSLGFDAGIDFEYEGNLWQLIHCKLIGSFKVGSWVEEGVNFCEMGQSKMGAHCHSAVEIKKGSGNWKMLPSLMDLTKVKIYTTGYPRHDLPKWEDPNFYGNYDAITGLPIIINNFNMATTQKTILLAKTSPNTKPINIRKEPKIADNVVGTIPPCDGVDFEYQTFCDGQEVSGIKQWYWFVKTGLTMGWIHGSVLTEKGCKGGTDCCDKLVSCETELKTTQQALATCKLDLTTADTTIKSYQEASNNLLNYKK